MLRMNEGGKKGKDDKDRYHGQDAGDDPRPAEEGDGRGDSHLAAEAVTLQSWLGQHATSLSVLQ